VSSRLGKFTGAVMYASINQVLQVWTKLEAAYYGKSSYAGDTAEIYFYLLLQHSPSYDGMENSYHEVEYEALEMFKQIFKHFSRKKNCDLIVDDQALETWMRRTGFFHRVHVKVVPHEE